jgi:hypothetical protein
MARLLKDAQRRPVRLGRPGAGEDGELLDSGDQVAGEADELFVLGLQPLDAGSEGLDGHAVPPPGGVVGMAPCRPNAAATSACSSAVSWFQTAATVRAGGCPHGQAMMRRRRCPSRARVTLVSVRPVE